MPLSNEFISSVAGYNPNVEDKQQQLALNAEKKSARLYSKDNQYGNLEESTTYIDGVPYINTNKIWNEDTAAQKQQKLSDLASQQIYRRDDGTMFQLGYDDAGNQIEKDFQGDTRRLYAYGTKSDEGADSSEIKFGLSRGDKDTSDVRYDGSQYTKPGAKGVDISKNYMDLLLPYGAATEFEGYLHGNKDAIKSRTVLRDDEIGRAERGSGSSEYYSSPEGVLGDTSSLYGKELEPGYSDFNEKLSDKLVGYNDSKIKRIEDFEKNYHDNTIGGRTLNTVKSVFSGAGKELVDTVDWIGEATNIGDLGSEEEKTNYVNDFIGYDPSFAEGNMKDIGNEISKMMKNKEVTREGVWNILKSSVSSPETTGQSIGMLLGLVVGTKGLGTGKKLNDMNKAYRSLSKSDRVAKKADYVKEINNIKKSASLGDKAAYLFGQNLGLLNHAAGVTNDDLEEFKKNNNGKEADAIDLTRIYLSNVAISSVDRFTDLSILKSGKIKDGLVAIAESMPKHKLEEMSKAIAKTAGELAINVGKEAAQEYSQTMGELFNVQYGTEKYGTDVGDILTSKENIKEGLTAAGAGAGSAVHFSALGTASKLKDKASEAIAGSIDKKKDSVALIDTTVSAPIVDIKDKNADTSISTIAKELDEKGEDFALAKINELITKAEKTIEEKGDNWEDLADDSAIELQLIYESLGKGDVKYDQSQLAHIGKKLYDIKEKIEPGSGNDTLDYSTEFVEQVINDKDTKKSNDIVARILGSNSDSAFELTKKLLDSDSITEEDRKALEFKQITKTFSDVEKEKFDGKKGKYKGVNQYLQILSTGTKKAKKRAIIEIDRFVQSQNRKISEFQEAQAEYYAQPEGKRVPINFGPKNSFKYDDENQKGSIKQPSGRSSGFLNKIVREQSYMDKLSDVKNAYAEKAGLTPVETKEEIKDEKSITEKESITEKPIQEKGSTRTEKNGIGSTEEKIDADKTKKTETVAKSNKEPVGITEDDINVSFEEDYEEQVFEEDLTTGSQKEPTTKSKVEVKTESIIKPKELTEIDKIKAEIDTINDEINSEYQKRKNIKSGLSKDERKLGKDLKEKYKKDFTALEILDEKLAKIDNDLVQVERDIKELNKEIDQLEIGSKKFQTKIEDVEAKRRVKGFKKEDIESIRDKQDKVIESEKKTKKIEELKEKREVKKTELKKAGVGGRILNESAHTINDGTEIGISEYFEAKLVNNNLDSYPGLFDSNGAISLLKELGQEEDDKLRALKLSKAKSGINLIKATKNSLKKFVKNNINHWQTKPYDVLESDEVENRQSLSRLLLKGSGRTIDNLNGKYELIDDVATAMSIAENDWLRNIASENLESNRTNSDINKLLGRSEDTIVEDEDINALFGIEGFMTSTADMIGSKIYENLGLKAKNDLENGINGELNAAKLKIELGAMSMLHMQENGLIDIKYTEASNIFGENAILEDEKGIRVFKVNEKGIEKIKQLSIGLEYVMDIIDVKRFNSGPRFKAKTTREIEEENKVNSSKIVGRYMEIAPVTKKALEKQEDTEYKWNKNFVNAFEDIISTDEKTQAFKEISGWINPETVHKKREKSVNGKNKEISDNIEYMKDLLLKMKDEKLDGMWFNWESVGNGRFNLVSNTFNIQSKKLHRFSTHSETTAIEIDPENKFYNLDEFKWGLGQAFDIKVDKQDLEATVNQWDNFSPKLDKLIDEGKSDLDILIELESEINTGEPEHMLLGITEYHAYKAHDFNTGRFETTMVAETDEVTGGYAVKLLQFPTVNNLNEQLERVGIYSSDSEFKDFGEYKENEGARDSYEVVADRMNSNLLKTEAGSKEQAIQQLALNAETVTRNFMKNPFMTFNYSAGISTIIGHIKKNTLENFYKLTETKEGQAKIVNIIKKMYPNLNEAQISLIENQTQDEWLVFEPEVILGNNSIVEFEENMNTVIDETVGEALRTTFEEEFEEYSKVGEIINNSTTLMFRLFKTKLDKAIEFKQDETGRILHSSEIDEIVNSMSESMPAIKTALAKNNKNKLIVAKTQKAQYKKIENGNETAQGRVRLEKDKASDITDNKGNLSITASTYDFIESYASGLVGMTHWVDGAQQSIVLSKHIALGVHDANIYSIKNTKEGTITHNKAFIEIGKSYSMSTETANSLVESLNNATEDEILVVNEIYKKEATKKQRESENFNSASKIYEKLLNLQERSETAREELFNKDIRTTHLYYPDANYTSKGGYKKQEVIGSWNSKNIKVETKPKVEKKIEKKVETKVYSNKGFKLSIDKKKKDQEKAYWSNAYIGFGVKGTSTYQYGIDAKKANIPHNQSQYRGDSKVFISTNGNNKMTNQMKKATLNLASKIYEANGKIIMDNDLVANSSWNKSGEAIIQKELENIGFNKKETTINGKTYNVFSKQEGKPKIDKKLEKKPEVKIETVKSKKQEIKWLSNDKNVITDVKGNTTVNINSIDELIQISEDYHNLMTERFGKNGQSFDKNTEWFKEIFNDIKDSGIPFKPVKVKFGPTPDSGQGFAESGKDSGAITLATDKIAEAYPIKVALHEYAHIISAYELKNTPAIKKRVREIMDRVASINPAIKKEYGFTSEAEFIAEAISSPRLQNMLKEIPSDKKTGNVFSEIKNIFRNILKRIKNGNKQTALTDTLNIVIELNTKQEAETKNEVKTETKVEPVIGKKVNVEKKSESLSTENKLNNILEAYEGDSGITIGGGFQENVQEANGLRVSIADEDISAGSIRKGLKQISIKDMLPTINQRTITKYRKVFNKYYKELDRTKSTVSAMNEIMELLAEIENDRTLSEALGFTEPEAKIETDTINLENKYEFELERINIEIEQNFNKCPL